MIESVDIQNFRCFERAQVPNLKRINIVVGRSASGKTAFLEALFLAAGGGPEIALRLRSWRGLNVNQLTVDRLFYESLWKDVFFSMEQDREVVISLSGSSSNTRSVRLFYDPGESLPIPLSQDNQQIGVIKPVTFEWTDSSGEKFSARPRLTTEGIHLGGVTVPMQGSFFPSSFQITAGDTANRFSELSKRNEIAGVTDALRKEFPFIKDLSLELSSGTPMIYAFIPPIPEKLPMTLVSGGIHKFFNLLLAIANGRQGIVLVDEIENEFYYDRMPHIWSTMLDFCQKYDSQLFASTHSLECLQAASTVAEYNSDDFCLLRTVRDDTRSIVRYFAGKDFQEAVADDIEVR